MVLFDQLAIVLNRLTVIDRVKLQDNRLKVYKKRGYLNFKITFGGPFSFKWFLPIPIEGVFDIEELYD